METPVKTLSKIAYGGYHCHVNATSGGVHTLLKMKMKMKMMMNFHCFDMLYIVRVTGLEPTVLASDYFGCFRLWLCCAAELLVDYRCCM
jgi:hypothetical protein